MKIWYNNIIDTDRRVVEVQGDRIRIGRSPSNEIVLDSPYVADEAAVLYRRNNGWELVALGMNGVTLGDKQLFGGERCNIRDSQTISLFPYTLTLDLPKAEERTREHQRKMLDERMSFVIHEAHVELLKRMDLKGEGAATMASDDEYLLRLERTVDNIARGRQELANANAPLVAHIAGYGLRDRLLEVLTSEPSSRRDTGLFTNRHWSRIVSAVPERETELDSTAEYVEKLILPNKDSSTIQRVDAVEQKFWNAWDSIGDRIHEGFKSYLALRHLKKELKDIVFGYGPLEDLLRLPNISEIMVVDKTHIYVERSGVLQNSGRRFISDAVIEAIIQRIVANVGRRIDRSQPLVDARLSDGSRVNAVIAPLAVSGPTLTIRKFPDRKMIVDDLIAKGAMTRTVAEFLRSIVLGRKNILISGGTGTGKTTLLNCLSDFIPDKERIVTVEDTAELQLAKEHVVRLETKSANVEGAGEYTIRDLVKNALRMRPDRIVVGECRGAEALDMLQAMNTGHDGSLTTIHANNSTDVILRLEVLVQMAADLPVESIRSQIASAIDVIVQLKRMRDGRRCLSQITEVAGLNPLTGKLETRDLFLLDDAESGPAQLQPTGRLPTFIDELISAGMLNLKTFYADQTTAA
ncbi:MAG TPA: ATPase, T2SS/T4P/T4SS family [Lacipirellulaceae bacterium]|jgi:Flp pilus assembly CpaF family ATPase|nr:ATPase, T2SS/T4P/T4SS family [Lacipirellulaceae bacterium]